MGLDALFRAKNAFNYVAGCPDGSYKLHMNIAVDRIVLGALCDAADAAESKGQVTFQRKQHGCIDVLNDDQNCELWKARHGNVMSVAVAGALEPLGGGGVKVVTADY